MNDDLALSLRCLLKKKEIDLKTMIILLLFIKSSRTQKNYRMISLMTMYSALHFCVVSHDQFSLRTSVFFIFVKFVCGKFQFMFNLFQSLK